MPLYVAPGAEARTVAQRNHFSRWHRKDAQPDEPNGELAFQRLRQPTFIPLINPAFKVQRSDKLFAIGSCFARGIEKALLAREMQVLSAAPEFTAFETVGPEVTGLGFTNKYNTFSIRNELQWALDPAAQFPEASIVELGEGRCYDPHINPTLPPTDWNETLRRRSILRQVNARIEDCRVVIVTLGLIEVWRDTQADTFINTTPPAEALALYPDRYEFQVSNFAENFANLEQIYSLLARFGHAAVQIIVTVSPVPLLATFTAEDVVVANSYSKSVLRTAAQEWAAAHENVHYFPSYEMVLHSSRENTWLEDLRHVRGQVVNRIMDAFMKHYLES